jgi:PAS domain S-box-containing protein
MPKDVTRDRSDIEKTADEISLSPEEALRQSAERLKESEQRHKLVSELATDYSFRLLVAPDKSVTMDYVTDNYPSITGRTLEETETVDAWSRFIHKEDFSKLSMLLQRLVQKPQLERIECRSMVHGNVERWVEVAAKSQWDNRGNRVTSIIGAVKDITERKQAEEALRRLNEDLVASKEKAEEQERLYKAIYHTTPVLMHSADLEGKITSVNDYWLETLEYEADEVLGTSSVQYLTESSRQLAGKMIPELLQNGMITNVDAQAVTKTGKTIDLLVSSKVVYDANGKPTQLMTTLLEVTSRKRAEEALRLREYYLSAIIENQPGLVWLKDAKSRFLTVNRAFALSAGKQEPEELIGRTDLDIWPEELALKYRLDDEAVMKNGGPVSMEELIFDKGEGRWFETFKTPVKNTEGDIIGTAGYAHDITVRKREEEAMRNVQKLESLGILAGGIAHDFNNLLGGIFGYIDLAAEKTSEKGVEEMLAKALATIDRARGLTQQLLTFAKGGAPVKKVESLISFILETAKFALSGSRVSCDFQIPRDLWLCEFDKNQIGQVIDNIVINAQQAMPDGGTIDICAKNICLKEKSHATLKAGNYVKVSIADRGIGMPREIVPRIFDPFFTTKTKGHGLGLATCYSIIHRHGGCIDVESLPGKGSTFHFYLPADPNIARTTSKNVPSPYQSSGTIIVMDDEEVIRDTVGSMLKSLGYSVISAPNGAEAILAWQREIEAENKIEAMILDLTVPGGMGGKEAVVEIRKIDRQVPVFVASGYADDPVMASPKEHGFTDSICKPFRRIDLAEMLRRNKGEKTES